jgi:hypothetical protein
MGSIDIIHHLSTVKKKSRSSSTFTKNIYPSSNHKEATYKPKWRNTKFVSCCFSFGHRVSVCGSRNILKIKWCGTYIAFTRPCIQSQVHPKIFVNWPMLFKNVKIRKDNERQRNFSKLGQLDNLTIDFCIRKDPHCPNLWIARIL